MGRNELGIKKEESDYINFYVMHLLYQKLSERWSYLAVGLLLVGLWATLLIQSSAAAPSAQSASQVSCNLTLPNIMAPVIRKEVHKEPADEHAKLSVHHTRTLSLWQMLSFQK